MAGRKIEVAVRMLSWHPTNSHERASMRRAMVTFPYTFKTAAPTPTLRFVRQTPIKRKFPSCARIEFDGEKLAVKYPGRPALNMRLLAPGAHVRGSTTPGDCGIECVFIAGNGFIWPDSHWPRVIEVRANSLGEVVVVGHLQRKLPDDGRAPAFWLGSRGLCFDPWLDVGTQTNGTDSKILNCASNPSLTVTQRRFLHLTFRCEQILPLSSGSAA